MNRETKYRGKRISDGEWYTGDLVTETDGNMVQRTFIHLRLSPVLFTGDSLTSNLVLHEVDPETVGQYTGLQDKNEKEIYEGDILREDNDDLIVIQYYQPDARFISVLLSKFQSSKWNDADDQYYVWAECEIIGNIYENVDLLRDSATVPTESTDGAKRQGAET